MPSFTNLEVEPPREVARQESNGWYIYFVCFVVAFTGLYHGYDNGVTSDVFRMNDFRKTMKWPEDMTHDVAIDQFLIVSSSNTFAGISAVLAGHLLVDRFGRKPALIIGSLIVALGGYVQATTYGINQLILGRVFAGIGEGITSSAGPAYISEVSPPSMRGAMVGVYQSNVCLAIVFAAILNASVKDTVGGWRTSLGVQTVFGLVGMIGMLLLGETPRFLEKNGKHEEALQTLVSLRNGDKDGAAQELNLVRQEIVEEAQTGSASWSEIFTNPHFRNVVLIGCLTQFFQIITGINAIVSYGGTLFYNLKITGLFAGLSPMLSFFIGNTIGAFVLADRTGRRPLLVYGMSAMATSLLIGGVLAINYSDKDMPTSVAYTIVSMVVIYMFAFGVSWGFGAWLYVSEIMPLRVRGKAVGLCTGVNWGPANMLSAYVTPIMINSAWGPGGTFIFFGVVSALVVPYSRTCIPETSGKALEEITPLFRFTGMDGFRDFVSGNLKGGLGASGSRPLDAERVR